MLKKYNVNFVHIFKNTRTYCDKKLRSKPFETIPGPYRWPVFGNLLLYKLGTYNIYEYHKVLKRIYERYGPIVRQDLGTNAPIIHVFDPNDAKTVYHEEGKMPYVAPLQETTQFYRKERNLSPGLGNTNGEEWYRLRSAVRQMMLRPKEVHYYLPMINETASELIVRLYKKRDQNGEVNNLRDEVAKWSRESSGMICFETKLGCMSGGETERLAQEMIDTNKLIFHLSALLKFSLPLYKIMKTPKWKKLLDAEDKFNSAGMKLVTEAVEKIKEIQLKKEPSNKEYNFLSYLLSKEELSDKDVTIITLSLFVDGLSTTVPSLLYNLYCLAVNPEVQDLAYNEIRSIINEDRPITVQDLNKLSYLKAVVKETFRVYPIGTEISRIIHSDLTLSGYHVPKKTHVNLNQSVHYDSEIYFKDPEKFEPDRWLRGENIEEVHPYLLIPFGHGTRTCAGRRFAEQDLYVLLSKILLNFRLEYPKEEGPLEQIYHTLLFPKGPVRVRFIPRE